MKVDFELCEATLKNTRSLCVYYMTQGLQRKY